LSGAAQKERKSVRENSRKVGFSAVLIVAAIGLVVGIGIGVLGLSKSIGMAILIVLVIVILAIGFRMGWFRKDQT
jgi:uncharacterized protein YacL